MEQAPSGRGGSHAVTGCLIGAVVAAILWAIPIPVAIVVWAFDLKGLFADYMYSAMPFFLLIPPVGAFLGSLIGPKRSDPRY